MAQGYIAQEKDYWIQANALNITLNALGSPNRIQASIASGAVIRAFLDNVNDEDTLGWTAAHDYHQWPLSASPTFFNSNTAKYVYVAIPKNATVGTQAVVVFPSELLDIYGKNANDEQIGASDYLYIFLQGIISATDGSTNRVFTESIKSGKLDTPQGDKEAQDESEWYSYSIVSHVVTFLKKISMSTTSWFTNLRLGSADNNLTGVAKSTTPDNYIDSDELVATPGYLHKNYLSKKHDDVAEGNITFSQDINVKRNATVEGDGFINGVLSVFKSLLAHSLQSFNYTGGDMTGTGWKLTDDNGEGNSSLIVDYLTVRMRAIYNALEIREMIHTAGNYIFSPAGSEIERVDYYNRTSSGGTTTDTLLGYEVVKVPWIVRTFPFLANSKVFASRKLVRVGEINMNDVSFFRCYLKSDDGTTRTVNTWQVGMLARCQSFDINQTKRDGDGDVVGNVFYWRKAIGISQEAVSFPADPDDFLHHYVDLSNISGEYAAGSMTPNPGDTIVCFGATTETYSHAVVIESVGEDAPALKEFRGIGLYDDGTSGINWSLTGKLKTKISPSTGNVFYAPHFYVEVGSGTTDVATFMVSTEGLLSEVKKKVDDGKNLLGGVLTADGWHNASNVAATLTDEGYITTSGTLISPKVALAKGTYTVSFYAASAPTVNCRYYGDEREVGITITQVSGESIGTLNRYKGTFTTVANNTRNYEFLFVAGGTPTIYHPQLEVGSDVTVFSAGESEQEALMKLTAEGLQIQVTNMGNKIPCTNLVSLLGWTDGTNMLTGGDEKTGKVGAANSIYSPMLYLDAGKYTFSGFMSNSYLYYVETRSTESGSATTTQYSVTAGTESYMGILRRYFTFTLNNAQYVRIKIVIPAQGNVTIYRPQLEKGEVMTSYVISADPVGSTGYINLTATTASVGVQTTIEGKLHDTGIEIQGTNREIKLKADKVNFYDSTGQNLNPLIWLDPFKGTLHAVDGVFDGTIQAKNLFRTVALTSGEVNSGQYQSRGNTGIMEDFNTIKVWIGFFETVTVYSETFTEGSYYCIDDIDDEVWAELQMNYNDCFDYCIGMADEVVIVNNYTWGGGSVSINPCVILPRCQDVPGKTVTIRHTMNNFTNAAYIRQTDYMEYGPSSYNNPPFCDGIGIANSVGGLIITHQNLQSQLSLPKGNCMTIQSMGDAWVKLAEW